MLSCVSKTSQWIKYWFNYVYSGFSSDHMNLLPFTYELNKIDYIIWLYRLNYNNLSSLLESNIYFEQDYFHEYNNAIK